MNLLAIRTEQLTRTYRKGGRSWFQPPWRTVGRAAGRTTAPPAEEFVALQGVNLEVRQGELFGLLGPNGAGKTTLIKILTTLLAPSSGQAWVDGLNVVTESHALRPRINMVSGGESSGYGILTVRENLWLFSRIYGVSNADVNQRMDRLLDVVQLRDKADSRVSHLSTGQRQKMNFCRGFLTDPKILFLDEPTLGLDVTAARGIRAFVKSWLAERPERTLLLTTHYMAEADELCDRLAIIDRGQVLACDTPQNLKRRVQDHSLFEIRIAGEPSRLPQLQSLSGVRRVERTDSPVEITLKLTLEADGVVGPVVQELTAAGLTILNLTKQEPTLEDVFIELVGHGLSDRSPAPRS